MANPYHDETGKFCSRSEMASAIVRLQTSGQRDAATTLMKEYYEIKDQESNISSPNEDKAIANSMSNVVLSIIPLSTLTRLNRENVEDLLNNMSYDRLSDISKSFDEKLGENSEELVELTNQLNAFSEKMKTEIGVSSTLEHQKRLDELSLDIENQANDMIDVIKKEAIEQGLPKPYAFNFMNKKRTILGFAPSYNDSFKFGNVIRRPDLMTELSQQALVGRPQAIAHREILNRVVSDYFTANQDKLARVNEQIRQFNDLKENLNAYAAEEEVLRKPRRDAYFAKSRLETAKTLVEDNMKFRKVLKAQNYTSDRLKTLSLFHLRGADISVGSDGKVDNLWLDTKNGVVRIVDVHQGKGGYGESDAGNFLLDDKGNKYQAFIHYANYGKTETDYKIIINPDIPAQGTSGKFGSVTGFASSVDTGG